MTTKHNVMTINRNQFRVKFVVNQDTFQFMKNREAIEQNKTIVFTFENGDVRSIKAYSILQNQSSSMTQGTPPNDEFLCEFCYEKGDVILSESFPKDCGKVEGWVINEY